MKVRSLFKDVDQLIFRGQISKNKNKTSKLKLATMSYPTKPIHISHGVGDRESWLIATLYTKRFNVK